jgi:hypothetical protein
MLKKILIISLFSITVYAQLASIERIIGNVNLNGVKALVGEEVKKGDVLRAIGKKSLFIIRYSNGSKYMLRNGRLKIDILTPAKSEIFLFKGKLVTSVKKKSYKKDQFKVKTRTVAMGVRGTKFWISEDAKESYLCVCEGVVSAKNKLNDFEVKRNEDAHFVLNSKSKVQRANTAMMDMALEDFKLMGEPVE